MYVSYNQDPEICPLYRGVYYRGVSIKRGFTVYMYIAKYNTWLLVWNWDNWHVVWNWDSWHVVWNWDRWYCGMELRQIACQHINTCKSLTSPNLNPLLFKYSITGTRPLQIKKETTCTCTYIWCHTLLDNNFLGGEVDKIYHKVFARYKNAVWHVFVNYCVYSITIRFWVGVSYQIRF